MQVSKVILSTAPRCTSIARVCLGLLETMLRVAAAVVVALGRGGPGSLVGVEGTALREMFCWERTVAYCVPWFLFAIS